MITLTPSPDQPAFEPCVWLALDGVNPASVTQELHIGPDVVPPPEVIREIEAKGGHYSSWILDTSGHVLTNRLSDHLDWLIARLAGREEQFSMIAASAARAEIMVFGARSKWEVDVEAIKAIRARLGVTLAFCVTVITKTV